MEKSTFRFSRIQFRLILWGLGFLLFFTLIAAVAIGPVSIPLIAVWQIVRESFFGSPSENINSAYVNIVWYLRLPRAFQAIATGSGLAVTGAMMQAVLNNPMADPYILGISSGASVGAVLVILFNLFNSLQTYALSTAAFIGGISAFFLVLLLNKNRHEILRLILSGVAVSSALSSLTSLLIFQARHGEGIQSVLFWLMGSLARAEWSTLPLTILVVSFGITFMIMSARILNALSLGEETAITLGVKAISCRYSIMIVGTLIVGVLVAQCGTIGFVGLIVPHLVRLFFGNNHRKLIPVCALAGSIFLTWVDIACRLVVKPAELPLGILTSLCGAPLFIFLLDRKSTIGVRKK